MPLYEYECDTCQHRFELIQKYSDPPAETCPSCGGSVHKLLSSPAIQFKGSGWYITDYARAGKTDTGASTDTNSTPANETKADSAKADSASASKGDATAESKTDRTSESKPAGASKPSSSTA